MKRLILLICLALIAIPSFAQKDDELLVACAKGDFATVKSLVESGANVNYKNAQGGTAIANSFLWPEQTQYLIDKGADPNTGGIPPLINAAKYSSKEVMKILLKAGADPNKVVVLDVTATFRTMIETEKAKGDKANKQILKIYEEQMEKLGGDNAPKLYALMNAMNTNCTECISMLINAGAKTDIINNISGNNLLHELATYYETPAKRRADMYFNKPYLEKAGIIFPDWYINLDYTKLGTAEEIVTLLLSKGVDLQGKNKLGHSPLYAAFDKDSLVSSELVLSLVNHGANINTDEGKGRTESPAIIEAAAYCSPEVILAILEKGGNINVEDRLFDSKLKNYIPGFTALINAVRHNNIPAARILINKGAKTSNGVHGYSMIATRGCVSKVKHKSALYFAIENGNMDMVKFLVDTANIWGVKEDLLVIDPIEKKETQDFGLYTITTTSCIGYEMYTPAKYAKALDLDEIYDYLKPKKLY